MCPGCGSPALEMGSSLSGMGGWFVQWVNSSGMMGWGRGSGMMEWGRGRREGEKNWQKGEELES